MSHHFRRSDGTCASAYLTCRVDRDGSVGGSFLIISVRTMRPEGNPPSPTVFAEEPNGKTTIILAPHPTATRTTSKPVPPPSAKPPPQTPINQAARNIQPRITRTVYRIGWPACCSSILPLTGTGRGGLFFANLIIINNSDKVFFLKKKVGSAQMPGMSEKLRADRRKIKNARGPALAMMRRAHSGAR